MMKQDRMHNPSIFLGASEFKSDLLPFFLKDNLISQYKGHFGKWLEHPLDVESLGLQKAFILSLLKKMDPSYDRELNPIKLILAIHESHS